MPGSEAVAADAHVPSYYSVIDTRADEYGAHFHPPLRVVGYFKYVPKFPCY